MVTTKLSNRWMTIDINNINSIIFVPSLYSTNKIIRIIEHKKMKIHKWWESVIINILLIWKTIFICKLTVLYLYLNTKRGLFWEMWAHFFTKPPLLGYYWARPGPHNKHILLRHKEDTWFTCVEQKNENVLNTDLEVIYGMTFNYFIY